MEKIAEQMHSHSINALLIIGGFEVRYCVSVSLLVRSGGVIGSPMFASHIPHFNVYSSGSGVLIHKPIVLKHRIAG